MFNYFKKLFQKKRIIKKIKNHHLIIIENISPIHSANICIYIKELDKYKAFNRMHNDLDKLFNIQLTYDDIQALEEIKRIVIDNVVIEYNPYFPMEIIQYK